VTLIQKSNLKSENVNHLAISGQNGQEMDKLQHTLWISGQSTKFQEFQESAHCSGLKLAHWQSWTYILVNH